MTSLALRMALEIGLPDAYTELCARTLDRDQCMDDAILFRKARVWFGVFVVENM